MSKNKKMPKQPNVQVPQGDVKTGKKLFEEHCSSCHALQGAGKSTPVLGGIVGKTVGSTSYPSSTALKKSKIIWTEKYLFQWIFNPNSIVPGISMGFAGINSEQDRADIIAYLKQN